MLTRLPFPVAWLIGMLSTKDHREVLAALLRPPRRQPASGACARPRLRSPQELANLAQDLCPELAQCRTQDSLHQGLEAIADVPFTPESPPAGPFTSIGHFFKDRGLNAPSGMGMQ